MRRADPGATRALPRWLLVATALLLGARVASGLYEKRHPSRPWSLVAWVPLEEAEARAHEQRRPILYVLSADWCVPCHMLEREVFDADPAARGINERYIPVLVKDRIREDGENPPAVQAFIDKHRLVSLPSMVLVGPDGNVVRQLRGYQSYTPTLQFLGIPTPSGL